MSPASRGRRGGGPLVDVRITVDVSEKQDALKDARKAANARVKGALQRSGERVVLPVAKRRVRQHAPVEAAAALVVKASSREARLTTSGPRKLSRIVGLVEFGGVVKVKLSPKRAQAMRTPWGPRAVVAGPRRYKARGAMQAAVQQTLPVYEAQVVDEVTDALTGELD